MVRGTPEEDTSCNAGTIVVRPSKVSIESGTTITVDDGVPSPRVSCIKKSLTVLAGIDGSSGAKDWQASYNRWKLFAPYPSDTSNRNEFAIYMPDDVPRFTGHLYLEIGNFVNHEGLLYHDTMAVPFTPCPCTVGFHRKWTIYWQTTPAE